MSRKRAYTTVYCNPDFIDEAQEKLEEIVTGQNADIEFDFEPSWVIEDVEDEEDEEDEEEDEDDR